MGPAEATRTLGAELAARLPLLGLVLIPETRSARVLWHDGPPDLGKVDALTLLGREFLTSDAPDTSSDDGVVVGFTVRDRDGSRPAAVFAVRHDAMAWTSDDRELLRSACATARDDLVALAGRPRPGYVASPTLEARVRAAVQDGEMVLLYQPEVDLRSGRVIALEALLRWDHPALGRIEPHAFIPLAERSDLITVLGDWVIDRALREFGGWRNDGITLRINVSPAQLTSACVVRRLARALADNGLQGSQVCVEFTETAPSSNVRELAGSLPALAELGITTALDDLATGYSTLSRLRSLQVDAIKIDRSVIAGIDADPRAQAIVRSLLRLADDLALDVVAEGIENVREADTLVGLGCHRGQGHYFARPLDAVAIADLLNGDETLPAEG